MRALLWIGLASLAIGSSAGANGLVNLSARGVAGPGSDALTAGFVVAGDAPKRVLVRGAGPALASLGVADALAQVRLEIFRDATALAANTGWDTGSDANALAQAARAAGAFDFAAASKDAALLLVLEPGSYRAGSSRDGQCRRGGAGGNL